MIDTGSGWAVGMAGFMFRIQGGSWIPQSLASNDALTSVAMYSANLGWLSTHSGVIFGWNGTNWTQSAKFDQWVDDISIVDANDAWACGSGGTIYHYTTGNSWQNVASPVGSSTWLNAVDMVDGSFGAFVGLNAIVHLENANLKPDGSPQEMSAT